MGRIRRVAAVGILLALVAGCSSFGAPGAPDRSFDEAQDIAQLEQEFQTAASIKGFYASGQTVDDRNRFIIGRLVLTDVHYFRFIRQFAVNKALIDSGLGQDAVCWGAQQDLLEPCLQIWSAIQLTLC